MKVALCSTFIPFVDGGARNIVEWLQVMLEEAGHEVERVYLPEVDAPPILFQQMAAFRFLDLSAADRVICFRPQSHLVRHPNKVLWFIHHLRPFYDLWGHEEYGYPDDAGTRAFRDALRTVDTAALHEARRVFTNSQVVGERLAEFNDVASEVLYPPILRPERFQFRGLNDEIVSVCRMEDHKRQHLLVEALQHCRSGVRVRLCGRGSEDYVARLRAMAQELQVADRLRLDDAWISEEDKASILGECLASAYLPFDEDSYGYPTLEAAHSAKATLTTTDSGGVLEFVRDGVNGVVVEPDARALAAVMDRLFEDRDAAARMGAAASQTVTELGITWPHVLEKLLA